MKMVINISGLAWNYNFPVPFLHDLKNLSISIWCMTLISLFDPDKFVKSEEMELNREKKGWDDGRHAKQPL